MLPELTERERLTALILANEREQIFQKGDAREALERDHAMLVEQWEALPPESEDEPEPEPTVEELTPVQQVAQVRVIELQLKQAAVKVDAKINGDDPDADVLKELAKQIEIAEALARGDSAT